MIPIFCINLERATERKELIQKEWIDKLDLNIIFWNGYDRRNIENNKFIYSYDKELAINTIGRQLSYGELACATSFCMLYEYLLENNYEKVIIMEDDITPNFTNKSVLFDIIKKIKDEFIQAEVILLHNIHPIQMNSCQKEKIFYQKKTEGSLCHQAPWGNQLFYIEANSVKKTYDILKKMTMQADLTQNILAKQNLVCIVNSPLCFHEWTGINSNTYIGNDFRNTKRRFIE